MRLVMDGVGFQLALRQTQRIWCAIIPLLAGCEDVEILLLDRGNAPAFDAVERIPFPSYHTEHHNAADSLLLQQVCDQFEADVFVSTGYTTPVSTPMALLVQHMTPELLGHGGDRRIWKEKEVAISYAQHYLCASDSTRRDLMAIYPDIEPARVDVAFCAPQPGVFEPHADDAVTDLKRRLGLERPYFLVFANAGEQGRAHNTDLFWQALSRLERIDCDVLYVGSPGAGGEAAGAPIPAGVPVQYSELEDVDLAVAYSGAEALVYPVLYEGTAQPVMEAMACGCPVITTPCGALNEVAADAACMISGENAVELGEALVRIRDPEQRTHWRNAGLENAKRFGPQDVADKLATAVARLDTNAKAGAYDDFFTRWHELRQAQASVDF